MSHDALSPKVLLFDGVCSMCNTAVDFIMRHERTGELKFAPIQSDAARELLDARVGPERSRLLRAEGGDPDTVLLIDGEHVYERSTAALHVAKHLRWPWQALRAGVLVPSFARDAVYRYVAAHRYAWFGKKETCRIPTPEERARFLS